MNATLRLPFESKKLLLLSTTSSSPRRLPALPVVLPSACVARHCATRSFSRLARRFASFSSASSGSDAVGVANATERKRTDSILADGAKVSRCARSAFCDDWGLAPSVCSL